MHARDLLELAALVSVHGPVLIECGRPLSGTSVEFYWLHSKCRLDHWGRTLKLLSHGSISESERGRDAREADSVIEDIFVSESLTRVWAAVLKLHDRKLGAPENEPIGRNILLGHLEARHRAMSMLLDAQVITAERAVALNRLRLKVERWTDLLIARLAKDYPVLEWACDADRAGEFADDLRYEERALGSHHLWSLTLTALRVAFPPTRLSTTTAELNARIAASVLGCMPTDLFNGMGTIQSLAELRLATGTSETQGMVEELLWTSPLSTGATSGFRSGDADAKPLRRRFG